MPDYRLSYKARSDLVKIAHWGIDQFGYDKARAYRDSLAEAIERLSRHPQLGSSYGNGNPLTRRLVCGSHVIYYKIVDKQIFIRRILHQSQDPLRHL